MNVVNLGKAGESQSPARGLLPLPPTTTGTPGTDPARLLTVPSPRFASLDSLYPHLTFTKRVAALGENAGGAAV